MKGGEYEYHWWKEVQSGGKMHKKLQEIVLTVNNVLFSSKKGDL
jgi:hypothetical protein